jgi:hypothetical protein
MKSVSLKTEDQEEEEEERRKRRTRKRRGKRRKPKRHIYHLISRDSYKRGKDKKCKADAKLQSCSASLALRHDTRHGVPSSYDSWCGLQLQDLHGEWSSSSGS